MSWMNSWQNWAGLGIYALALVGAVYPIGHVKFMFEERARRRRRRAIREVNRKMRMNQEQRFRTFIGNEEVGK